MRNYLVTILAILLYGCANKKPLTGGEKDTKAPQILVAQPKSGSININPKTLVIEFDEPVQENDIQNNLIITPRIDNPYKAKVKGRKLILEFEKSFDDSTTYSIYLDNCVQDITERNPTKNLNYVFSTGNYIDSLKLNVEIKNIYDQKTVENALVCLYSTEDTLDITNSKPLYFGYTSSDGKVELKNIKYGSYNLYAIEDENKNMIYDANETIAFIDSTIRIDTNLRTISLHPHKEDIKKKQDIKDIQNIGNTYKLTITNKIEKFDIVDSGFNVIKNINNWFTDDNTLFIEFSDSTFNGKFVSYYSDNQKDTSNLILKKGKKLHNNLRILDINPKPEENLKVELFVKPKLIIDSMLYFVSDSMKIENNGLKLDSNLNIIEFFPPKDLINYKLHIDSNAIQNDDVHNKEMLETIKVREETETGIIKGKVNCKQPHILQLLDKSYKIVEELFNVDDYTLSYIKPGTYKIRLILDQNGNKKWDDASFKNKLMPEKVIFHKSDIIVKENWEISDINISCE